MSASLIYLDYAAATPLDRRVLAAMEPYFSQAFYNPSASYSEAIKVRRDLEAARARVAASLGARPSEIIFTAGATEASNLAINGIMKRFPAANMLVSSIEHEAVLAPARQHMAREIKVDPAGRLDLDDLRSKIDSKTVLVSVMQANNEIGTLQPLKEVAQVIRSIRTARGPKGLPLHFHSDAAQGANYLDLHVSRLGVDLMSLNGGKIYGPKQSGALYVRSGVILEPLIYGGGQERGLRSGTENVAGAIGFSVALELAQASRHNETRRLSALQKQFMEELKERFPSATINGSLKQRLPNNVHLTFENVDAERLVIELDEAGVKAATSSACSASKGESSHVLKALGKTDAMAASSLRFSLGRDTTPADIQKTLSTLTKLTNRAL